jgi:hypothetical protein
MDLEAIKARAEAATPGPWFVDRGGEINDPYYSIPGVCRDRYGDNSLMVGSDRPTADFIAHARTDVPALVAEVEELRADLRIADDSTLVLLGLAARCARAEARVEELEEELRMVHAPDDFEDI